MVWRRIATALSSSCTVDCEDECGPDAEYPLITIPGTNMKKPIRLVVAQYHTLFRQGLKSLLAPNSEFKVVGEVEQASELKTLASRKRFDVILLDPQMDRWVMQEISWLSRRAAVVVLTASEDPRDIDAAIKCGARAVVLKRFSLEMLIAALRAAADGLIWFPPATADEFAKHLDSLGLNRLTSRESTIVRYVAGGLRNAEVAEALAISENTVKVHLTSVFRKLAIRDRVELAHYAIRNGLINLGFPARR